MLNGGTKKKKNDSTARTAETRHCNGKTFILRGRLLEYLETKPGDSFWRTPGGKHHEEDGIQSFQMKVNEKKVFAISPVVQQCEGTDSNPSSTNH